MTERNIKITEETYTVREKLENGAYNVKTDPYHLNEQAQIMRNEAGVRLTFYARIPRLETREENALLRRFELDMDKGQEGPVPPRFMQEVFALDGLYLLSNEKTSDGRLKLVEEVQRGEPGTTQLRELDDHWELYLDPATADLLGLASQNDHQPVDPISGEILAEIEKTRLRMGLTREDIRHRITERRDDARIR